MTAPLLPPEREELRRLLAEATPGPWAERVWHGTDEVGWTATGPHCDISEDETSDEPGCSAYERAERDAALIVAMHAALPRLLAALDAAERDVMEVRRELERVKKVRDQHAHMIDVACKERDAALAALATARPIVEAARALARHVQEHRLAACALGVQPHREWREREAMAAALLDLSPTPRDDKEPGNG